MQMRMRLCEFVIVCIFSRGLKSRASCIELDAIIGVKWRIVLLIARAEVLYKRYCECILERDYLGLID